MTAWKRPPLDVRAPNRRLGGLYRSADIEHEGTTLAGVPMQTVSDAVLATVKLGYRVADRQIARGRRLGRQLQGAAQRAGADDPNEVIEQSERLLLQALTLGLEWVEGAAVSPRGPMRRLLQAEYRWIGRWLGLDAAAPDTAPAAPVSPPRPAATAAADRPATPAPAAEAAAMAPLLPVLHTADAHQRRPVRVHAAQVDPDSVLPIQVHFHHASSRRVLVATLQPLDGRPVLALGTERSLAAGRWRAVVCDARGLQIGSLEIEL